jgi:hypothetical protein
MLKPLTDYTISQLKDLAATAAAFNWPNAAQIEAEIDRKNRLLFEDYLIGRQINFEAYIEGRSNDWKRLAGLA